MELAQRTASALSLANDAAKADLAQRMVDGADAWVDALAADDHRARQRARDALGGLESALTELAPWPAPPRGCAAARHTGAGIASSAR